jgi:protease-4
MDPFAPDGCTIAGINAHGSFVTYASNATDPDTGGTPPEAVSEYIISAIRSAEDLPNVKGILIDIDSYGGVPVAGEEVADALKEAKKPTVALIRGAGTSAAYWAATGADTIIASALSDVGGIGVTSSYVDASKYNQKEGYTFNQLSTGLFKDYGNPDKPLTEAERTLIMRDLQIINDAFMQAVATNRNMDAAKVKELADGSSMLGNAALTEGLIDRIGSYTEAEKYLEEQLGEKPVVCW